MLNRVLGLLLSAFFVIPNEPAAAAQTGSAQVMIVGVAHLVARRDVHNSTFTDDPLSSKRQAQVADVVDHLARFHPTKVLIEADYGDPKIVAQYQQYRAGHYTLGANEIYQFGFKLAARWNNPTIYPIDTFGPAIMDDSTASGKRQVAWLKTNLAGVTNPAFASYMARDNALQQNSTYLDLLRYLNTDEAIHANASIYSQVAGMGRDTDNAGAAWVAQWYARNVYIFSNILSVIRPGDRVVVLMGQGHEYLLREFVRLNANLVDVDPLTYLK